MFMVPAKIVHITQVQKAQTKTPVPLAASNTQQPVIRSSQSAIL